MRKRLLLGVGLLAALITLSIASAARPKPALTVPRLAPLTVKGSSFVAHERVKVTVQVPRVYRKTVTAGRRGGFTLLFQVQVAKCTRVTVAARGSRGSRATTMVPPSCGSREGLNRAFG
jgi:hypothetical protein